MNVARGKLQTSGCAGAFGPWVLLLPGAADPDCVSLFIVCSWWSARLSRFLEQVMDGGGATAPAKIAEQYLSFFRALEIDDEHKVLKLARLLRAFNDVAMQLDNHLAPVGASLHSAVCRMCMSSNPLVPP